MAASPARPAAHRPYDRAHRRRSRWHTTFQTCLNSNSSHNSWPTGTSSKVHPNQDRVEVETLVDAMACLAQPGQSISQRRDFTRQFLCLLHVAVSYAVPKILEPRVSAKTGCESSSPQLQNSIRNRDNCLKFSTQSGSIGVPGSFGARRLWMLCGQPLASGISGGRAADFTVRRATADGADARARYPAGLRHLLYVCRRAGHRDSRPIGR